MPRLGPGPVQAALALPLLPAARLSGEVGLQAAVSPPDGHQLTCTRARRALGLREVPEQVHGGGVGRHATREQRRAPHPAAARSTPSGGRSDGAVGARAPSIYRRRAHNATNRRAAWPGRPRILRAGGAGR